MRSHVTLLNPSQYGSSKAKNTNTNLVTSFDFISPIVSSECQVISIYFDLRNTIDVLHSVLLHILCAYGVSDGYVKWFHSYLSNRQSFVRVSVTCSLPFEVFFFVLMVM